MYIYIYIYIYTYIYIYMQPPLFVFLLTTQARYVKCKWESTQRMERARRVEQEPRSRVPRRTPTV